MRYPYVVRAFTGDVAIPRASVLVVDDGNDDEIAPPPLPTPPIPIDPILLAAHVPAPTLPVPRYKTQMRGVTSEDWRAHQNERKAKRIRDEAKIREERRARNAVIICVWIAVCFGRCYHTIRSLTNDNRMAYPASSFITKTSIHHILLSRHRCSRI